MIAATSKPKSRWKECKLGDVAEFKNGKSCPAVFYRNPEYSLKRDGDLGRKNSGEKTVEKTREKTREKILALITEHPHITTNELAKELSITSKGVEWNLKQLRDSGLIRRVGPDKGGHTRPFSLPWSDRFEPRG